jgi:hypothetical protein
MAVTSTTFLRANPEFAAAGAQLVVAKLAEAALRINAADWGTAYDLAHSLMTAHLLWSSPFGSSMRLDGGSDAGRSRYLEEFERLRLERLPRMLVLR